MLTRAVVGRRRASCSRAGTLSEHSSRRGDVVPQLSGQRAIGAAQGVVAEHGGNGHGETESGHGERFSHGTGYLLDVGLAVVSELACYIFYRSECASLPKVTHSGDGHAGGCLVLTVFSAC